jgi:hypothetical protein
MRTGVTLMNNVQVYNCSQYDTQMAAIRFEGASGPGNGSSLNEVSVSHGLGPAFVISDSNNVQVTNGRFTDHVQFGLAIYKNSFNITFDSNILIQIWPSPVIPAGPYQMINGGFVGCVFECEKTPCNYSFTNNIAAGIPYAGYVAHGHTCGDYTQTTFRGNVAHSNFAVGAIIFPDPFLKGSSTCLESSFFYAYKNQQDAIFSMSSVLTIQFTNMIFVDNAYGPSPLIGYGGDEDIYSKMSNITIWGDSPAHDCPVQGYCKVHPTASGCLNRIGFMLPYFQNWAKNPSGIDIRQLPLNAIMGDAPWGGHVSVDSIAFRGFTSPTTWCGTYQTLIALNPTAADYQPKVFINNSFFENIHDQAFTYLITPFPAWATIDLCGNWPCTGPLNYYIEIQNAVFNGSYAPSKRASTFSIVPYNRAAVTGFGASGCSFVANWNGYFCATPQDLGILLFESQDDDARTRIATPISLINPMTASNNTINTFMNHQLWHSYSNDPQRLSRYAAIVQTSITESETLIYTGTVPSSQRFKFLSSSSDKKGIVVSIPYKVAGVFNIFDSKNNKIPGNGWSNSLKQVAPIQRTTCGENRYVGVANILQFYITPGCLLYIKPSDVIQSSIRMAWTLEQFYADGGATTFADRMAAALGVKQMDIKVVAAYEGSTLVSFTVE